MEWIPARLAASRVCGGSHSFTQSVCPPVYSANRSRPSQCLEADLHRDVREGEIRTHGAPGHRSTYLVPRTVRPLECTLKTHLVRGGPYARHSRTPSPGTCQCDGMLYRTAHQSASASPLHPTPSPLPKRVQAMDCLLLSGARYLREPNGLPCDVFRPHPHHNVSAFRNPVSTWASTSRQS